MSGWIDLNADLGEGCGDDAGLMAVISSCNIACGGHAGDEASMRAAVRLASAHGVRIGAHPSYPDREGFGRRVIEVSASNLKSQLVERIQAIRSVDATSPDVMPNIPLWISLATLLSLGVVLFGGSTSTPDAMDSSGKDDPIDAGYFRQVLLFLLATLTYLACLGLLEIDFRILSVLFMVGLVYLIRRREPVASTWKGFPWDACIVVPLLILVFWAGISPKTWLVFSQLIP